MQASDANSQLLVKAQALREGGGQCADTYLMAVNITGKWAVAGLHSAEKAERLRMKAEEEAKQLAEEERCQARECCDAVDGTKCFKTVMWLKSVGFSRYPDTFIGFSKFSSVREVQGMLYKEGKGSCARPCEDGADRQLDEHVFERKEESLSLFELPPDSCHTAEEDDECYRALQWLRGRGLRNHPDWFPGLTSNSSRLEMQAALHSRNKTACYRPCAMREHDILTDRQEVRHDEHDDCGTPDMASRCSMAIFYARSEGIKKYPGLFPGLDLNATFKQAQQHMWLRNKASCPKPCMDSRLCKDAIKDDDCWGGIKWAMDNGIKMHPEWYPGLSPAATFTEIQAFFYETRQKQCPPPC